MTLSALPRALARAMLDRAVARRIGALPEGERFVVLQRTARRWAFVLGRIGIDPTALGRPFLREEHALRRVMWTASRLGYAFDPVVTITGLELIAAAHAARRGLLLSTVHCPLNGMMARAVDDLGIPVTCVQRQPEPGISDFLVGRGGRRHETIGLSSRTFLDMRKMWRRGGAVLTTLDGPRHPRARTHVVSNTGEMFVQHGTFEIAVRLGVPVLFMATTMTDTREIRLEIERPCPGGAASVEADSAEAKADALAQAFVAFLRRQTTERLHVRVMAPSH